MKPDGVHVPEMPHYRGRPAPDDDWPAGDPALASFAEDLLVVASGPAPQPRPGLVAVMGRGVDVAPGPQPRRSKMLVKTVLGSLAAKVALGVGVAAASVTAVGATGVLPDQAQHAVASVVGATTPFVLPDRSVEPAEGPEGRSTSTTVTSTPTTLVGASGTTAAGATSTATGDDPAGAAHPENHGACVSTAAQDKSGTDSHGKTVSSVARSDCGKPTTSTTVPASTTTSSTVAGTNRTSNSGPGSVTGGKASGAAGSSADDTSPGNSGAGDTKGSSSGRDNGGGSGGSKG